MNISEIDSAARGAEQSRISEISAIAEHARKHLGDSKTDELMQTAIRSGWEVNDFRKAVFYGVPQQQPTKAFDPSIGMSRAETKRYSLSKAVDEASRGQLSGLEREVSDEARRRDPDKLHKGTLTVPQDVLDNGWMQRDSLVATSTLGGFLVGTTLQSGSFVDALRARVTALRLGGRTLQNLVGNVNIPRLNTSATINWTGEVVASTESNIHLGMITLSPKCATVFVDYSKMLAITSTPDIESILRNDLANQIAAKIDQAVYHGVATGPVGLETYSGVNAVTIGTNGGAISWAKVLEMEEVVATANADLSTQAFVTNAKVRRSAKGILKNATATDATYLWNAEAPGGPLNGYRCEISSNIASNLTTGTSTTVCSALFFGSFDQVLCGFWGGLDVLVDPYTQGTTRIVRLYASQFCDVNFRVPQAFARCLEVTT